jgi:hypothetical protein
VLESAAIPGVEVEKIPGFEREGFEIEIANGLCKTEMLEAIGRKRAGDGLGIGIGTQLPEIVQVGVAADETGVTQFGNRQRPAHVGGRGILHEVQFFHRGKCFFLCGGEISQRGLVETFLLGAGQDVGFGDFRRGWDEGRDWRWRRRGGRRGRRRR